ncbi:DJ-1/PfpI family protein [Nitrosospira sp. NpAV]|uniref:DJ-1/PfpI family protein n=1 Tax=Nitrosospira sp. NpAV TaxID=58133 RepID=UPI000AFD0540|nr:DJ-1/PfpI family protein [Nitrosospira sp. NpAV]
MIPRTSLPKPEQVPADSKPTLDTFTKNIGFTPNMMATFAQSPIAFNAWATLLDSLSKALDMKIRAIITATYAAPAFAMMALVFAAVPAKAGDNSINVAVIVYDGVLTSDITAPLEVFGNAAKKPWLQKINVETVAADGDLDILTEEGIKLKADRLLAEAPSYDVIIVPSRYDMDTVLGNRALIDFIRNQSKTADWMASNCSGALVLAEAGVLDGKRATTWAGGEASFQKNYPNVLVQHDINLVIDDGVLTSNGSVVSYEAAIALLAKLTSDELAAEVANDLQFKRVANAVLPPRLHWKLASVIAAAAFLFGAFVAGLTFLIRTKRTKR